MNNTSLYELHCLCLGQIQYAITNYDPSKKNRRGKMKSKREIFDIVKKHLLTQGKRSFGGRPGKSFDTCLYRSSDGLKCAVGCLIDDEHYTASLEGLATPDRLEYVIDQRSHLLLNALRLSGIPVEDQCTLRMLRQLQSTHDTKAPKDWPEHLNKLEEDFFAESN